MAALRQEVRALGEHAAVLFVVDDPALADDHPILVVDLSDRARAAFRCVAHELWDVDNNLNLANMNWDEFADNVDQGGVFQGFPSIVYPEADYFAMIRYSEDCNPSGQTVWMT